MRWNSRQSNRPQGNTNPEDCQKSLPDQGPCLGDYTSLRAPSALIPLTLCRQWHRGVLPEQGDTRSRLALSKSWNKSYLILTRLGVDSSGTTVHHVRYTAIVCVKE
ncbi:MAG: hypothetical protein KAU10_04875 [Dehalococcoidia bacterium]|nr:hypothetical protein [Dehalococcoidia bacterium]